MPLFLPCVNSASAILAPMRQLGAPADYTSMEAIAIWTASFALTLPNP